MSSDYHSKLRRLGGGLMMLLYLLVVFVALYCSLNIAKGFYNAAFPPPLTVIAPVPREYNHPAIPYTEGPIVEERFGDACDKVDRLNERGRRLRCLRDVYLKQLSKWIEDGYEVYDPGTIEQEQEP